MKILSIETSCDETSASITNGRRILRNVVFSQIDIHSQWGGIVPHLAARAHREKIDMVVNEALRDHDDYDHIAVTYGPGLAPALEVGIRKAKELATIRSCPLIPVNHMEGHVYSCFAQDENGIPEREIVFPYLVLLVSGGHTELIIFSSHATYEVIGKTRDDAVGEALDKGARMLVGKVYPGGPIIEKMAQRGDSNYHIFPRPMRGMNNLDFSYSGIKTSLYYLLKDMSEREKKKHANDIASSFQEAIFDSIIWKLEKAMEITGITNVLVGGGVVVNKLLQSVIGECVYKKGGKVFLPTVSSTYGDNAGMIGVAAYYKTYPNAVFKGLNIERAPRASLSEVNGYQLLPRIKE